MAGEPAEAGHSTSAPGSPEGLAVIDREFQAWRARLAGGVSPIGFSLAYLDWLAHLAGMPGRRAELAARAWRDAIGLAAHAARAGSADAAGGGEPRDWRRLLTGMPLAGTEAFVPGKSVAVTPGKVVFRNRRWRPVSFRPNVPQRWAGSPLVAHRVAGHGGNTRRREVTCDGSRHDRYRLAAARPWR
jgi:Poly-beta-hydroxybutyrate polymerase N terminal